MRIIIHGGMPKTGTTALQQFLAANETRLRSQGILYPRSGRRSETDPAHHALFLSFLGNKPLHFARPFWPRYASHEYVLQLQGEIDAFRASTVILSSEHLFSPVFDEECMANIRKQMSFSENVVFYCVLRPIEDLLPSLYAQHVSGLSQASRSPRKYLQLEEGAGTFDYEGRLRMLEDVFGAEKVIVQNYENVRTDIVRPFRDVVGYEPDSDWAPLPVESNRRLSWPVLHLMRLANALPLANRPARRALTLLDSGLFRGRIRHRLEAPFKPYSAQTLRRVARRLSGTD